jgi:hypothetical protein
MNVKEYKLIDLKDTIDAVLYENKAIFTLFEEINFNTEGIEYYKFIKKVEELLIRLEKDEMLLNFYLEFLLDNTGNTLPKTSSGSLYQALIDSDNFLCEILGDGMSVADEEAADYFDEIYSKLFGEYN